MLKGKRQVAYVMLITAIFFYSCEKEVISNLFDIDGNEYKTITIGKQVWMAENLKVTHYRDGTAITNVTDNAAWAALTTEAYSIFNNNSSNELDTYGALYNWYAVANVHNIAPEGWHVATDTEWTELETYLSNNGHNGTEGTALKSTTGFWSTFWKGKGNGTDDYGFTTLPGGYRKCNNGYYSDMGTNCSFWSATEHDSFTAWYRQLHFIDSDVTQDTSDKEYGYSVRLVRD